MSSKKDLGNKRFYRSTMLAIVVFGRFAGFTDIKQHAAQTLITKREKKRYLELLNFSIFNLRCDDASIDGILIYLNLSRLLAVGLEVPEETFVRQHNFDAEGETYSKPPILD